MPTNSIPHSTVQSQVPSLSAPPSDIDILPAKTRKTQQSRSSIKLNWRPVSERDRHGQAAMRENEKPTLLTRRQILASGVAMAGAIPFMPTARAAAAPEP